MTAATIRSLTFLFALTLGLAAGTASGQSFGQPEGAPPPPPAGDGGFGFGGGDDEPDKPADPAADKPRTGQFTLERPGVPAGRFYDVMRRVDKPDETYFQNLADGPRTLIPWSKRPEATARWAVYVPAGYDPARPAGVMVFVSASPQARAAGQWDKVLDDRNLILISPHDAENALTPSSRIVAAITGLDVLAEEGYRLDPDRVYASGFSGGGRVATLLMWHYSDIFTGGFPQGGANHPRELPAPAGLKSWFTPIKDVPPAAVDLAKSRGRYAYSVGSEDFNHAQVLAVAEDMRRNGFRVTFVEQAGKAHEQPDAEHFEKGVLFLDAPLAEAAAGAFAEARKLDGRTGQKLAAAAAYRRASTHGFGADFADEAGRKADELESAYKAEVEAIRGQIAAGQHVEAARAVGSLSRDWGRESAEDAAALRREVADARRAARP